MQFSFVHDFGRFDLKPTGLFLRSYVNDRRGDPHGTFHFDPAPGNYRLTPHLTRRGEERIWLPEIDPAAFWAFFEGFTRELLRDHLSSMERIDLQLADAQGWRLCMTAPPSTVADRMIREGKPDHLECRLTSDVLGVFLDHVIADGNVRPIDVEDCGPEGPSPTVMSLRWNGSEIIDAANWTWAEYGYWDPYTRPEATQVHPRGWYRRRTRSDGEQMQRVLRRLLGHRGLRHFKRAAMMIANFFGPMTGDLDT